MRKKRSPPDFINFRFGTDITVNHSLNRLLIAIAQLPGIYRSSHQDYPEAFNRTLEWVSKNIDRFERRSPDVQRSFVTWINGYLKWRIRDLDQSQPLRDVVAHGVHLEPAVTPLQFTIVSPQGG